MKTKIDAGFIQDIWHGALAMQGSSESSWPHETIVERMDASRMVQNMIAQLSIDENGCLFYWDEVCPRPSSFRTLEDMERVGRLLQTKCREEAMKMNIDPRSGDRL